MKTILTILLLSFFATSSFAQGTLEDYKRANAVRVNYSWKMGNGATAVYVTSSSAEKHLVLLSRLL